MGSFRPLYVLTLLLLHSVECARHFPKDAAQKCDCKSSHISVTGKGPACGEDGLIYSSECLAICQGVPVADLSACPVTNTEATLRTTPGVNIPREKLFQFSNKGFKLLGRAGAAASLGGRSRDRPAGGIPSEDVDFIYTADGYLYGKKRVLAGKATADEFKFSHERTLKDTIFGDNGIDDRTEVHDTTANPFKRVGLIQPVHCTGALVGPRHVLTSAHCVWNTKTGFWYEFAVFTPAKNDSLPMHFGAKEVDHALAKSCFIEEQKSECDFGMIVLKEDIGVELGWFDIALNCDEGAVNLHTAGYPLDKSPYTMWREDCGSAEVSCSPEQPMARHTCDVVHGMSGAPLWDDLGQLRGVHRGVENGQNVGVYISPFVFDSIYEWLKHDV